MNSIAQFAEALPAIETLKRGEDAFTAWRREMVTWNNRRIQLIGFDEKFDDESWQMSDKRRRLINELTQAEIRIAEKLREIIEVAGQIYAEARNAELLRVCDCLNREQRDAENAADAEMRTV